MIGWLLGTRLGRALSAAVAGLLLLLGFIAQQRRDAAQDALSEARDYIVQARAGAVFQIDRAAEVAASKIKGVEASEVRPVVESLVNRARDNRYGVTVTLDGDGNVRVDPSGLASKLTRKAGKWLKKVF